MRVDRNRGGRQKVEERLKELKERIEDFIIKNNVTEFYIDIDRSAHAPTNVELTIKI